MSYCTLGTALLTVMLKNLALFGTDLFLTMVVTASSSARRDASSRRCDVCRASPSLDPELRKVGVWRTEIRVVRIYRRLSLASAAKQVASSTTPEIRTEKKMTKM
jgi:hypothetical protein